jgi:hypothetical protein
MAAVLGDLDDDDGEDFGEAHDISVTPSSMSCWCCSSSS